jgi:hypothetical protein
MARGRILQSGYFSTIVKILQTDFNAKTFFFLLNAARQTREQGCRVRLGTALIRTASRLDVP